MKKYTIRLDETTSANIESLRGDKSASGFLTDLVNEAVRDKKEKDSQLLKDIREIFDTLKSANLPDMSAKISEILINQSGTQGTDGQGTENAIKKLDSKFDILEKKVFNVYQLMADVIEKQGYKK